jgi:hypothetical protein
VDGLKIGDAVKNKGHMTMTVGAIKDIVQLIAGIALQNHRFPRRKFSGFQRSASLQNFFTTLHESRSSSCNLAFWDGQLSKTLSMSYFSGWAPFWERHWNVLSLV